MAGNHFRDFSHSMFRIHGSREGCWEHLCGCYSSDPLNNSVDPTLLPSSCRQTLPCSCYIQP